MSLCINPGCSQPKNTDDHLFCEACGAELLLEGRYRVQRLLGQGGFSRTYEISDLESDPKVLKVLKENEPKYIELFQREAQVLSQLNHPGIPKVAPDAYFTLRFKLQTEPLHCMVMEKISGLDLQKYQKEKGGPIDQKLAIKWLIQLANILQMVHQKNFLHRDIKPSNIMLKADGHVILIDFGTARSTTHLPDTEADNQVTRVVSALYSPDEQVKGHPVPQSDFFALGRTFVFLLTGKDLNKFYNPTTNALEWRQAAPEISTELADLLDQLMAPLPSQRPANAQVLLRYLQALPGAGTTIISAGVAATELGFMPTQVVHAGHPNALSQAPAPIPSPAPTSRPSPTPAPAPAPANVATPRLNQKIIARWERELAEFIGPIAAMICRRTLAQHPQILEQELVELLAQQITSPVDAQAFRQRLFQSPQ
jgi:eukaryotic-like serine/threonine-protein kinase